VRVVVQQHCDVSCECFRLFFTCLDIARTFTSDLTSSVSGLESPTSLQQALLGCCMPQRTGEGSGTRQKPKTNLETDEFASNPPFSKIYPYFRGND